MKTPVNDEKSDENLKPYSDFVRIRAEEMPIYAVELRNRTRLTGKDTFITKEVADSGEQLWRTNYYEYLSQSLSGGSGRSFGNPD